MVFRSSHIPSNTMVNLSETIKICLNLLDSTKIWGLLKYEYKMCSEVNIDAQSNAFTLIKSSTGSKTLELIAFLLYTGMYCSTCINILYKYIYCEEEFQNLSQSTTNITTSLPSSFHQKTYKIAHIHHLSNAQFPRVCLGQCVSFLCVCFSPHPHSGDAPCE